MKQVRIEEAGPYVDVIVYPILRGRPDRFERSAAVHCSSDLRTKMNDRTSAQKFRRLIAANFAPKDFVVTLTYSDQALPATPELARDQKLKPFLRRVRSELRGLGFGPLKYMYVTEGLHGDKRLHHHIIVPNVPYLKEIIKAQWDRNGHVGFDTISTRGYEHWASYLTKEPRKTGRRRVGDRMWTPSLHLTKPTVTTYEVEDSYQYEPPPGGVIKQNEEICNEWFNCQYVSYYRPSYLVEN